MTADPPTQQPRAEEPPARSRPGSASDLGRVWAVGAEFAATAGAAALIGYLFDWLLGTSPWGMIGWIVVGLLSGFIRLVREAGRLNREAGRDAQRRPPGPR